MTVAQTAGLGTAITSLFGLITQSATEGSATVVTALKATTNLASAAEHGTAMLSNHAQVARERHRLQAAAELASLEADRLVAIETQCASVTEAKLKMAKWREENSEHVELFDDTKKEIESAYTSALKLLK